MHCSRLISTFTYVTISAKLCLPVAGIVLWSVPHARAEWIRPDGPSDAAVQALAASGSSLFAGTLGAGVYRSSDNGATWDHVDTGLTDGWVNVLVDDAGKLYAGTVGSGVFRSSDNGNTWMLIDSGLTDRFVYALLTHNNTLYAGTSTAVFRSSDRGDSWVQLGTNESITNVIALAAVDSQLFAGTYGGVYVYSDSSDKWIHLDGGLGDSAVSALATDGQNLYAGTYSDAGVFSSSNYGANWTSSALGLLPFTIPSAFVAVGDCLIMGANWGVYTSYDGGVSWNSVSTGLMHSRVLSVAVNNGFVFAGTDDGSVYRRPLSEVGVEDWHGRVLPSGFALQQNYPNPFNPTTSIQFTVPRASHVTLEIFNVLGQKVATLADGPSSVGDHTVVWDGTGDRATPVSSGVYLYRLQAGDFIRTRKMVLVK